MQSKLRVVLTSIDCEGTGSLTMLAGMGEFGILHPALILVMITGKRCTVTHFLAQVVPCFQ